MDPSRIDIDSCLCPDGKWQCPVGDCNQKLSRKQTLKQHITSLHDIDVRWEVKQYKLYEFDQSIPVPRSTQAWKRKRLRETSTCSSSASPEKPPDIGEVRDIS
ncbi:uncharacterized protein LOC117319447 [Pecten maximus]|nr:uncharacterized protein LOC117319447 [Pecten maximus]